MQNVRGFCSAFAKGHQEAEKGVLLQVSPLSQAGFRVEQVSCGEIGPRAQVGSPALWGVVNG